MTTSGFLGLRVAITNSEGHKHAYRLGKIDDHTDILTGTTTGAQSVAETLKAKAEAEIAEAKSGSTVAIEELIDNGDGTSTWKVQGS